MQCTCAVLSYGPPGYAIFFPHCLINGAIFEKKIIEHKTTCFDFLSTVFIWNISHSKKNWERGDDYKMFTGIHVRHPIFLPDFNETWVVSTDLRKILKYKISRKSVQWVPSFSMLTDGHTALWKLIVAFRNFSNAPVKGIVCTNFMNC